MFELEIVGTEESQRFRVAMVDARTLTLGRSTQCDISVPWDRQISRMHAEVALLNGCIRVTRTQAGQNPLVFKDKKSLAISVLPGEEFRIGRTIFRCHSDTTAPTDAEAQPYDEYTFAPDELRKVPFLQTQGKSLELLARIPQLMRESGDDAAFAAAMVDVLLEAIPRCYAAAVVVFDNLNVDAADDEIPEPSLVRWNSRDQGDLPFRPSRRLLLSAIRKQQSVLHLWDLNSQEDRFTNLGNLDWAFCTPLPGDSSRGWCLYVSGTLDVLSASATKEKLQEAMRFTELTAQFIDATRSVRSLQQTQTRMSGFLPPAVVKTITNENADEMLRPRTSQITVLFCDLRGFSKKTEQADGDLVALLARISDALSAMMSSITEHEGVIADFQGDAALSFWGWPQATAAGPVLACRAALSILKKFDDADKDENHPLHGLKIGIGIGHGPGIAGQIGPPQQSKVGVFGAVVNQASRLQGMTKLFHAPILIDDATATVIGQCDSREPLRFRRVACVRPRGMDTVLTVSQLLPSDDSSADLSDEQLEFHERAIDLFIAGQWDEAEDIFETRLPEDPVNLLLRDLIAKHDRQAPDDWNGIIAFRSE